MSESLQDTVAALRKALEAGPTPGPHHIYTHPRDDNNHAANQAWHEACCPQRVAAVLGALHAAQLQAEPEAWRIRQGTRTYFISNAEFVRSSFDAAEMTPLHAPKEAAE